MGEMSWHIKKAFYLFMCVSGNAENPNTESYYGTCMYEPHDFILCSRSNETDFIVRLSIQSYNLPQIHGQNGLSVVYTHETSGEFVYIYFD